MLAVGMDGPIVNLLYKNKLKEEFSIMEVGTCLSLATMRLEKLLRH